MTVAEWVTVCFTVGMPMVGLLVWLVNLQGWQRTHERECAERNKHADERHLGLVEAQREMRTDIKEILHIIRESR